MREIKFRVWDKILNEWCVYKKHEVGKVMVYCSQKGGGHSELQFCLDSDDFEVVQYIDRKDANDIEVFEGDILCHDDDEIIRIFWGHPGFCFTDGDEKEAAWEVAQLDFDRCKVIGNIYENPELLEG